MQSRTEMARLITALLLAAAIGAGASPAAAQPAAPFHPPSTVAPLPPAPRGEPVARKEPATAAALAIGLTVGGYALVSLAGTVEDRSEDGAVALALVGFSLATIGPSTGHFYAGETGRGVGSIGVRMGGIAAMGLGATMLCILCDDEESDRSADRGVALILLGMGVYAGATIYDFIDAPRAARRTNRRRAVVATPTVLRGPDGAAPGFVVGGAF